MVLFFSKIDMRLEQTDEDAPLFEQYVHVHVQAKQRKQR